MSIYRCFINIIVFFFCVLSFADCKHDPINKDDVTRVHFMLDSDLNNNFLDSVARSDDNKIAKGTKKTLKTPRITIYE